MKRPYLLSRWSLTTDVHGWPQVTVHGRTESGVSIAVNGRPVQVVDGQFTAMFPATVGCFAVTLQATHPDWPVKAITRTFSDAWNPEPTLADFDLDGDVDDSDRDLFEACATGPGVPRASGCHRAANHRACADAGTSAQESPS